jgi:hypothetical protein
MGADLRRLMEGRGAHHARSGSHFKNIAKRLEVPGNLYGQARRLLRDQIKSHAIHIGGTGLDLGSRDEADAV